MNEVWNLDPIYKGFSDPAYEADMTELAGLAEKIQKFSADLAGMDSMKGLKEGISLDEQFSE